MKIFYFEGATWEVDYILVDLLNNVHSPEVVYFGASDLQKIADTNEIIDNHILIISSCIRTEDIIRLVKQTRPLVVFYLSDEWGNCPDAISISNHTKLFFHQYNHSTYTYGTNNIQIPCAYVTHFFNGKSSLNTSFKLITDRSFNVSFVGQVKADRVEMINECKRRMLKTNIVAGPNNWQIGSLAVSPQQLHNMYTDSVFVLAGRGNISLDCFRIYEAIVAGAIPVVVAQEDEIYTTFNYDGNVPPFIYADSWPKAIEKCNKLLQESIINPAVLQNIQNDLVAWWYQINISINSRILEVVNSHR